MAQKSQVPKFGDWENDDNVPYSMVFEKARSDKRGGKPNPSDLRDNSKSETPGNVGPSERQPGHVESESRGSIASPLHSDAMTRRATVASYPQRHDGGSKPELEVPKGAVVRVRRDRLLSQEGDLRKPSDSPLHSKSNNDSSHHSGLSAGDTPKRATRQNVGSDRSIEPSPLHPQSQARVVGKVTGVTSPSWERKGSSGGTHGVNPSTPVTSRHRSVGRGDETPDHGTVLPKFGDWDENDPGAAEGYSHIFSKVREERLTGDRNVPFIPTETSFTSAQKSDKNVNLKSCWCIPWGKS